ESLGDALMRVARYSAIHNEGVRLRFHQRRQMISIDFDYVGVARLSDCHQIEFFATILVRLCRVITGRRLSPETVRLAHRRTTVPAELATLFGCGIEFGLRVAGDRTDPVRDEDALLRAKYAWLVDRPVAKKATRLLVRRRLRKVAAGSCREPLAF